MPDIQSLRLMHRLSCPGIGAWVNWGLGMGLMGFEQGEWRIKGVFEVERSRDLNFEGIT